MKAAWKPMDSMGVFWLKFLAAMLLISILVLNVLPINEVKFESPFYYAETLLWVALSIASGACLYFSAFPETPPSFPSYCVVGLGSALIALAFFHAGPIPLEEELAWWRGGCSLLITFITVLHALVLFNWGRRGAARSPRLAGLWAALSAASLGCALMQPVCLQDTSLHLLLWHFFPLAVLSLIGAQAARLVLRW